MVKFAGRTVVRGVTRPAQRITDSHISEQAGEALHDAKEVLEDVKDRVVEEVTARVH